MELEKFQIQKLTERIKNLEDKVFKKSKKEETTRAQQMLMLKHLGVLEIIEQLTITKKSKSELLASILNMNADNIEHDLTEINSNKSPLRTKKNYEFLVNVFARTGLKEKQNEAQSILDELLKKG